jgi:hypothetical protein
MLAEICEALRFRIAGEFVELPMGEHVELIAWKENDELVRAGRDAARLVGFLPIEWLGKDRLVPIKALRPLDDAARDRIRREHAALAKLTHRNQRHAQRAELSEDELEAAAEANRKWVDETCAQRPWVPGTRIAATTWDVLRAPKAHAGHENRAVEDAA